MRTILHVLAAGVLLCACGDDGSAEPQANSERPTTTGARASVIEGETSPGRMLVEYELPSATLLDWASSADAYAVFVLTEATEQPVPAAELESEDQLVPVALHMRLESVLWQKDGARSPTGEFTFETIGWTRSGDVQAPVLVNNSPDWVEGARYVGPLRFFAESGAWEPINPGTLAIVSADGLIEVPDSEYANESVAQLQSRGKTPTEVAGELSAASA